MSIISTPSNWNEGKVIRRVKEKELIVNTQNFQLGTDLLLPSRGRRFGGGRAAGVGRGAGTPTRRYIHILG